MKASRWVFAYNFNKNGLQIPMTIYSYKNTKDKEKGAQFIQTNCVYAI